MNNFDKFEASRIRLNQIIGNELPVFPDTSANVSRDRLLRVKAGLLHLLTEVIPGLSDSAERDEIYLWVDGIHTIIQCEESESERESKA
ncbi:TPA: transcriptional regulator [Kluyvera intermedia]|nr:transcriptional regulator [Kluyvera intermedia]